jgi:hypothetical protein
VKRWSTDEVVLPFRYLGRDLHNGERGYPLAIIDIELQRGDLDERAAANAMAAVIRPGPAFVAAIVISRIRSALFAAHVFQRRMLVAAALAATTANERACENADSQQDVEGSIEHVNLNRPKCLS